MTEKELLQALGFEAETLEKLGKGEVKAADLANEYSTKFEKTVLERQKAQWEKDFATEYQKQANIAVYNKIEQETAKTFELDFEKYKSVDKDRLKKMLSDAKEAYNAKMQEIEAKAQQGKDANVVQLQKQLEEQALELKRLKELEAELPAKIENERKAIEKSYLVKDYKHKALTAVMPKLIDAIDIETVDLILSQKANLDVAFDEKGTPILQIKDPATGTLAKRSNTENYSDLSLFIEEVILKPKKWAKMQGDSKNNPEPPSSGQKDGKPAVGLHPNYHKFTQQ